MDGFHPCFYYHYWQMSFISRVQGRQFIVNKQKYVEIATIGEGGQGAVYKVVNAQTSKEYALKVVVKSRYQELNKLMEREIEIMSDLNKLKCPSIIKLMDKEITKEYFFLVMELGEYSLANHKELFHVTLNSEQTLTLIQSILLALQTVHKIGIIHRDIKPHNIIVNNSDCKHPYKLTDFGVAANKDARGTTYIGTEPYMAPEVLQSKDKDNQYTFIADIWSFALVVFEAYFGFNPFCFGDKSRREEQVRLIEELTSDGFNFGKLQSVLEESNKKHLASDLRKKYEETEVQIIEFLTRGLHKNPNKRITLEAVKGLLKGGTTKEYHYRESVFQKEEMTSHPSHAPTQPYISTKPPMQAKGILVTSITTAKNPRGNYYEQSQYHQNEFVSTHSPVSNVSSNLSANQSFMESSIQEQHHNKTIMTPIYRKASHTQVSTSDTPVIYNSTPNHLEKKVSTRDIEKEKCDFVRRVREKIQKLRGIVKHANNTEFETLLEKVIMLIQDKRESSFECKAVAQKIFHKLYKLYDSHPALLQQKGMRPQSVIQFLYELIIFSQLSPLLTDPKTTIRGLPQTVSYVSDPSQYFKYSCNSEMLKEFEWRFFSKGNLVN